MKSARASVDEASPSDHRRIASGALRVAFFLLLAKALGALKEMAVAFRYGVSEVVDAYQFTMVLATWLPVTLVGALSVVLIPALVHLRAGPEDVQSRFMGELHTVVLALGAALTLLLALAWPGVLDVFGGELSPAVRAMSITFMMAFAPAALLIVLTGLSAARLRARERHVNTLLDGLPAAIILIWVVAAGPDIGLEPLLWGTLLGFGLQALTLLALANRADGLHWRPRPSLKSASWASLAPAAGIFVLGQLAMSLVAPLDQYAAAQLGDNANAVLGYATRLLSLILGLGALSVGRAALPVLADMQTRDHGAGARRLTLKWSAVLLVLGGLAGLVGWWLTPWGVGLLFERGAFTSHDTREVALVVRWGLIQLPFYFGAFMLMQLLASQHRYRLMTVIALAAIALKLVLNPWLAGVMHTAGLMLATGIMQALFFLCCVLAVVLRPGAVPPGAVSAREPKS